VERARITLYGRSGHVPVTQWNEDERFIRTSAPSSYVAVRGDAAASLACSISSQWLNIVMACTDTAVSARIERMPPLLQRFGAILDHKVSPPLFDGY
jgi:hypothetical protein